MKFAMVFIITCLVIVAIFDETAASPAVRSNPEQPMSTLPEEEARKLRARRLLKALCLRNNFCHTRTSTVNCEEIEKKKLCLLCQARFCEAEANPHGNILG